eukprot:1161948-Pelagomonas_calceolata.AAC.1
MGQGCCAAGLWSKSCCAALMGCQGVAVEWELRRTKNAVLCALLLTWSMFCCAAPIGSPGAGLWGGSCGRGCLESSIRLGKSIDSCSLAGLLSCVGNNEIKGIRAPSWFGSIKGKLDRPGKSVNSCSLAGLLSIGNKGTMHEAGSSEKGQSTRNSIHEVLQPGKPP